MTYNEFISDNLTYRVANQNLSNNTSVTSSVVACINSTIVYFNTVFGSSITVLSGKTSGTGTISDLDRNITDDMDTDIVLGAFQDRVVSNWFIQTNALANISTASIIANNSEEVLKPLAVWDPINKKLLEDQTDHNDYIAWNVGA